jgi:hypothetical protein
MALTSPSPKDGIQPLAATIVGVAKDEPYPTGAPPDFAAVVLRVHSPQENTDAVNWQGQSQANLAAGGMISGGAAWP